MIIGIYDDEQKYLKDMELLCQEYAEKTGKHCDIILFQSEEELLKSSGKLDVLFLDIQMEGMNGLDIQEALWQSGSSCFIVYMTNYAEYANEAYNANVIGFLYKPVTYDMAERALNKAERNKKDLQVLLEYNGKTVRSRDVLYLEAATPFVNIYFAFEKYSFPERGEMKEWEEKLKELGFFRVHHSYLINMAYVVKYTETQATLYKEVKIPISRRKYKEFKNEYKEYWEKRRERR